MRVVQPDYASRELARRKEASRRKKRRMYIAGIVSGLLLAGCAVFFLRQEPTIQNNQSTAAATQNAEQPATQTPVQTVLRQFTGDEFKALYSSFSYPFTEQIASPPPITNDPAADLRIQTLATERGYSLRSSPMANQLVLVAEEFQVQKLVAEPLSQLLNQLNSQGVPLKITSAYRSIDDQLSLFINRLAEQGVSIESTSFISEGLADEAINNVLATTAPPGYSRHHTGYTIDFQCGEIGLNQFATTDCYRLMSADNYALMKEFGFIPSYPEGTSQQGPEPEAWEYIWVGRESLYQ